MREFTAGELAELAVAGFLPGEAERVLARLDFSSVLTRAGEDDGGVWHLLTEEKAFALLGVLRRMLAEEHRNGSGAGGVVQ